MHAQLSSYGGPSFYSNCVPLTFGEKEELKETLSEKVLKPAFLEVAKLLLEQENLRQEKESLK